MKKGNREHIVRGIEKTFEEREELLMRHTPKMNKERERSCVCHKERKEIKTET